MKTRIVIAMHKPYEVPKEDVYLPLFVGAAGKDDIFAKGQGERDDTGDNISVKNSTYCELTGLYWAWKNLDADAIGLVHYRRYFKGSQKGDFDKDDKMKQVLSSSEVQGLMDQYDIVVPAPRHYYIESLYSHYAHTLDGRHLDLAQEIIHRLCPEYDAACQEAYKSTWGYMFNMCIMKREYVDAYCRWLFPILGELEKELADEMERLSTFEARLFGRVSEILFNVWIRRKQEENKGIKIHPVKTLHMEPVNWLKKGSAFLQAKFFGKKYGASF